ncbi:putative transcriptional regulator, IclR family [Magnetospira sp. QH-2]|nr:putative transcriptional regulator, IclR family [Magnetospira sp. QH-2]
MIPVGTNDPGPPARRKIQSVERALSLLELLAEAHGGARLNDISKTLELNVSTCHHLLSTLMDRGYVTQSGKDRAYFLGNMVSELSGSRMRQFDLADVAMSHLRDLNGRTGETVHLATLHGDELVTIARLESHHAVRVVSGPGSKSRAFHATATGKAILAWLPEREVDRIIDRTGLPSYTDQTITDRETLTEERRLVRRNGFSVDREEFQPGVICIGAAIRDHTGAVIGSFSCSLPTMRADKDYLRSVETDVVETARAISDSLEGADQPTPADPR